MSQWRCDTHNTTLDVVGTVRHFRGTPGTTGVCGLAQPVPETKLADWAAQTPAHRVTVQGKSVIEAIKAVTP